MEITFGPHECLYLLREAVRGVLTAQPAPRFRTKLSYINEIIIWPQTGWARVPQDDKTEELIRLLCDSSVIHKLQLRHNEEGCNILRALGPETDGMELGDSTSLLLKESSFGSSTLNVSFAHCSFVSVRCTYCLQYSIEGRKENENEI